MTEVTDKVERAIARFDRVTRQLDERGGPVARCRASRAAAAELGPRRAASNGSALAILVISIITIAVGLFIPIGMFGFLAAVGLAIGVAALLAFTPSETRSVAAPLARSTERRDGPALRFLSVPHAPRPASSRRRPQIDGISSVLPALRQTLERVETLDPTAQDARRLMSIHLPGLIDRYMHVPAAYRSERDGEDKTVDQRLIEGLAAGRTALHEIGEKLARADVAGARDPGTLHPVPLRQRRVPKQPFAATLPAKDGNGASRR